jgi:rhodanese-related sulfurtransferase
LYDSLFQRVLKLDPVLAVYPAHDYKGRAHSTIGDELATNPRLQQRDRAAFITMMQSLNLTMPKHLTEALRVNMTGGKSVAQMLNEAAASVPFMSLRELRDNEALPDPTMRIVVCCEFGRISTLAAATLRSMGYQRAVALDDGLQAWRETGHPLRSGTAP